MEYVTSFLDYVGLSSLLQNNQFASAGIFLGIVGGVLAYLRHIPHKVGVYLVNRFTISFDIWNDRDIFAWVEAWINEQGLTKKCKRLYVSSHKYYAITPNDIFYSPSEYGGSHWFWQKKLFIIERLSENIAVSGFGSNHARIKKEGYRITIPFGRREDMVRILSAGYELYKKLTAEVVDDQIQTYVAEENYWEEGCKKPPRPLDSVILQKGIMENIVERLDKFVSMEKFYINNGLPYHLTFGFFGEPGSGKTSTIYAIASYLKRNIYYINPASTKVRDTFARLVSNIPPNSLLVIEDIDSAKNLHDRDKTEQSYETVDLATVLNSLDGILSPHGMLCCITSNKLEHLDSALIRPGRVDDVQYFGNADKYMITRLYLRFRPKAKKSEILAFVKENIGKSMAEVSQKLLQLGPDMDNIELGSLKRWKDNNDLLQLFAIKNVRRKGKT